MATAGARTRDGRTPPPIIAKAGRYTVFLTPPAGKPNGPSSPVAASATKSRSPISQVPNHAPSVTKVKAASSPTPNQTNSVPAPTSKKSGPVPLPKPPTVPVQVPPPQFSSQTMDRGKPLGRGGIFGFFWNAVVRVQDAHASLDEHLAEWFGLNRSKYQWALNDYHGSKGLGKESGKPKERVGRGQNI